MSQEHSVGTVHDFDKLLKNGKLIVMFSNSWCGVCKMALPKFLEISESNTDNSVAFAVVDGGSSGGRELHSRYEIDGTPTFIIFHNGKHEVISRGYSQETMRKISEHAKKRH